MICKANNKDNTIKFKHSVHTHKKSRNNNQLSCFIIIWEQSTIMWKRCTSTCLNGKRDQAQVVICQAQMAQITAAMMACAALVKLCCLLQRCRWKPNFRCSENYRKLPRPLHQIPRITHEGIGQMLTLEFWPKFPLAPLATG